MNNQFTHHSSATTEILPAGAKDSHGPEVHGHVIIPMRLLVTVLAILLIFTVLTVAAANAEQFFASTFDVHIPGWVNAVVALSIAAVKSIVVAMYFMQLRYDHNPMNALVAVFTVMVLTFFLGFIAIDLGNRGILYQNKSDLIIPGGTGGITKTGKDGKQIEIVPPNKSIAQHARERADKSIDQSLAAGHVIENPAYLKRLFIRYEELSASHDLDANNKTLVQMMKAYIDKYPHEFDKIAHEVHAHGHAGGHAAGGHGAASSNANISRPRSGITLTELEGAGNHGEHAAPAHNGEPAKGH